MDPAQTTLAAAAEQWGPPRLAGSGGGRAVEASSTVTGQSEGSRRGGGSGRRRQRDSTASVDESSRPVSTSGSGRQDLNDSEAKRFKASKSSGDNGHSRINAEADSRNANKAVDQNPPPPEPPKQDYIHVRARRGQATDNHSLAERARREKITERMKVLQDLVPGCNKVIGKASVLDEIINYVQALECQVEFLSMKLETVNAHMNNGVEAFPSKDFGAQTYSTAPGLTFDPQTPREHAQGSTAPEWRLHMQMGGSYERVTSTDQIQGGAR